MPRKKKPLDFQVLGIEEISSFFLELGKVPQKTVKKAARAGAVLIRRKVVASPQLPVEYGFLKLSLQSSKALVEERARALKAAGKRNLSGKAGFDVMFDPRFNSIFQKPIKRPGLHGASPPKDTGYYPASMEYGFKTANGAIGGHYFMKKSAIAEESSAQDKMLEVISKEIDKLKKG